MSVLVLCGRHFVAEKFTNNILGRFPGRVEFIEAQDANYRESHVEFMANQAGVLYYQHENEDKTIERINRLKLKGGVTTIVLAWWPRIVHKINKLGLNVINTHPSYLPYNRGKHPYHWAIVNGMPFGATIHRVDDGIDTGEILWQKRVHLDPTDTGQTAYNKAADAMLELLYEHAEDIALGRFPTGIKQDEGTSHFARELEAQPIQSSTEIAFINDLRARTFDNNHSGRKIVIDGITYRVHLKLVEDKS